MQADSLLRIHLHTHNIRLRNAKYRNDEANITGVLHDNQMPIHIVINRYIRNKYSLKMLRYTSDTPPRPHHIITNFFTPTDKEKALLNPFFVSTPLPILQQHLITLFAQWTNAAFTEHTKILSQIIGRIPRKQLGYSDENNKLFYYDAQNKEYTYWDSLNKIHSWCNPPQFIYTPQNNTWEKEYSIDIISYVLSRYQWDDHHPLSMHETIKLIRQAQALNIPCLPKDLSGIRK